MKRFVCLGVVLCLSVVWSGCGDVFRPIIIPTPPIFPSPAAAHTVLTISDNGATTNGSAMVIDVSGDSVVSTKTVGLRPMHAAQQSASSVLVANQSVTDVPEDSISKLTYSGTTIQSTTTITLPPSYDPTTGVPTTAAPNFVASMEANQGYVLLPGYQPVQTGCSISTPCPITPAVDVFSTQSNSSSPTPFAVGVNPVAMVETQDGKKLYVANEGNSTSGTATISAFNTGTLTLFPRTIYASGTTSPPTLSSGPIWLAARSDSQQVYVLESNGTLAYLNTSTAGGPDTFTETSIVVPGTATYMWYDMILNRLYIPSGSQLTIVDVSQSAPTQMATVSVPDFQLQPAGSPSVPATAIAATSLPDGTRAYVTSVPSTPDMVLPTEATITSVRDDAPGIATYAYTLNSGHDITPGVTLIISGLFSGGTELTAYEGTLQVSNVVSGTQVCPTGECFQIFNSNQLSPTTVSGSATGENIFPQVTLVNTNTNTATPTPIAIPGFAPYDAFCSPAVNAQAPRFRFMMAAGGDSSRVYLSSCDGGNVNIIDTITESYIEDTPTANSQRPPIPPSQQNAPQNPTFMIAGP